MLKSHKKKEMAKDGEKQPLYGITEYLKGTNEEIRSDYAEVTDLQTFLKTAGKLSIEDMLLIVEQALLILEMFYVHLFLKRTMYAIDPIQQLKLLKHRLEQVPEGKKVDEIRFHIEMIKIFTSLHDLHTNYLLPAPFNDKAAFLPFLIEEYFEGEQRRYIVSKTATWFNHPTFKPGVEVAYWNGIPINRAVELNADRQAGSNTESQHALGLDSMAIRPLKSWLPPDEEWVVIVYRSIDGEEHQIELNWLVLPLVRAINATNPNSLNKEATALGIDIKTTAIQQVKEFMFAPNVFLAEKRILKRELRYASIPAGLDTCMPRVFKARAVETRYGTFGYIRIFTFDVNDDDQFIAEFIRLAELLPQNGLIIDVRHNGGGLVYASERLLQLLTPHKIKPEPAQFIYTALTYNLCCQYTQFFGQYTESMKQADETGSQFSRGFPLTSEDACNSIGQKYLGPVILITDALSFSSTDILAGGFQDNEIGPILGTDKNTGAGGANVFTHELLLNMIGDPLKALPNGAGISVAIRRTLRVLGHEGMLMEDFGVSPNYKHDMTKEDVLSNNVDLINHAASILAKLPVYKVSASVAKSNGKISITTITENISRLDVYLDGHPQRSTDINNNLAKFNIKLPKMGASLLELQGFKDDNLVAIQRIDINSLKLN